MNTIKLFDRRGDYVPVFFNNFKNDDFFRNFFEINNSPATNIVENEKEFRIELSVPGYNKEDLNIKFEKELLTVSAKKESKTEEKDDNSKFIRREFVSSSFKRSFNLSENIDKDHIEASHKNGVLSIILPKLKKAVENNVKQIEVK